MCHTAASRYAHLRCFLPTGCRGDGGGVDRCVRPTCGQNAGMEARRPRTARSQHCGDASRNGIESRHRASAVELSLFQSMFVLRAPERCNGGRSRFTATGSGLLRLVGHDGQVDARFPGCLPQHGQRVGERRAGAAAWGGGGEAGHAPRSSQRRPCPGVATPTVALAGSPQHTHGWLPSSRSAPALWRGAHGGARSSCDGSTPRDRSSSASDMRLSLLSASVTTSPRSASAPHPADLVRDVDGPHRRGDRGGRAAGEGAVARRGATAADPGLDCRAEHRRRRPAHRSARRRGVRRRPMDGGRSAGPREARIGSDQRNHHGACDAGRVRRGGRRSLMFPGHCVRVPLTRARSNPAASGALSFPPAGGPS